MSYPAHWNDPDHVETRGRKPKQKPEGMTKVTVELTDADSLVKPGMTAAVNITIEEIQDVLLVPNRAVRLVDGERVVYLLVDGLPVKTGIRLGSSSDTVSVLAGGDVVEGDVVILNPPVDFGPGGGPGGGFGN